MFSGSRGSDASITQRAAETCSLKASLLPKSRANWWGSWAGAIIDEPIIRDAHYHDAGLHNPEGAYQSVFGLDVDPAFRRQGIAEKLLMADRCQQESGQKRLDALLQRKKDPLL